MLALTSDWYWEQDRNYRFTFLAATGESGLQHVVNTALGKTRREIGGARTPEQVWRAHEAILERHEPFREFEFEADDGYGRWRWISVSGEPVFSAKGRFLGYRGIAREITSRKLSEEQAREAEIALAQAGAAIFSHDLEGKILSWSRGAEQLLGYSVDEMIGRNALEVLSPERDRPEFPEILHRIRTAASRSSERTFVRKTGEELDVEVWAYPFLDREGVRRGQVVIARDISAKKRAERALAEAEARFHSVVELAPDAILVHDNGRIEYANRAAAMLFAAPNPTDLIGRDFYEFIHEADRETVRSRVSHALRGGAIPGYPMRRIVAMNGELRVAEVGGAAIQQGGRRMILVVAREATERHLAERRLRESEERYRALFDVASDAIVVFDLERKRFVDANANAERLFGMSREELLRTDPVKLSPQRQPDGSLSAERAFDYLGEALKGAKPVFEWTHLHASGREIYCEIRLVRMPPFDRRLIRGSIVDITDKVMARRALEEKESQLRYLATHDALTGLANRTLLNERFRRALERAERYKTQVGVLFLDLDRFKNINDTLGHYTGDRVLEVVGELLRACVRTPDTVARHGGDEFVVLVEEMSDREDAERVARRIMQALAGTLVVDGRETFLRASIGIAIFPHHGRDADALIRAADEAMYLAKQAGRNNYQFYDPSISVRTTERVRLEGELRRGLMRQELRLHYQPKVRMRDGRVSGFEALLRWERPGFGLVSPAQFIALAEETGLIVEMGYWALREAVHQLRTWLDEGVEVRPVAINFSPREFLDPNLVRRVREILTEARIEPRLLQLEVTENVTMENESRSRSVMRELVELGVSIAMDDFGTGYSSLANIMKFPISTLKIDRSFVSGIPEHADAVAVTQAVMAMGKSLGLEVVAEGVESKEQVDFLLSIGCETAQGYYFSAPLPAEQAIQLLLNGVKPGQHPSGAGL
ncbi:MAG TPA: EAL domain-containing protein [Burkholderiales bacterium]|jgi:diguanylate cyclase (GGDEF)-like protein/PAS domain S-box-containing protein|nr:EAL domain-containing protein [Burkholderiales bacterium]